jgi:geranylgeranyl diphosphate synthase type II
MDFPLPQDQLNLFDDFLHKHFERILRHGGEGTNKGHFTLIESLKYSLFSGGKRFRPSLGFLLGKSMNVENHRILPWLAAVECIHTYSLIHDDLPSMDNDALRRGKPTNHILFGEATALLAGDALLTEAFSIVSRYYFDSPSIGLPLVQVLSQAAGIEGMVGGQAMDLASIKIEQMNLDMAELIHHLKTGALIRSVCEGVAVLAQATDEDRIRITQFGIHLGFAFQLKDDLLDYQPQVRDPKNIACHLSSSKTLDLLREISRLAEQQLKFLGPSVEPLLKLIKYNVDRLH